MAGMGVQQQQVLSILFQLLFLDEFNQFFTHFCKQLCVNVPWLWVADHPTWRGSIPGFIVNLRALEDDHWRHGHPPCRDKGQQCSVYWFLTWNCLWTLFSFYSNNLLLLWDVRNTGFVDVPDVKWLIVQLKSVQQFLVEPEELCCLVCIGTNCSVEGQVFGIFLLEVRLSLKKSFQPPGTSHLLNRTKALPFVGNCQLICQLSKFQISEREPTSCIKYNYVIQVFLLFYNITKGKV